MPCPNSADNPDYRAAWLPALVHPVVGAGDRQKRNPDITGLDLAIVDQIRIRFRAAVATRNLVEKGPREIGQLLQWPLLPLWEEGGGKVGLVELRPYPVPDHFVAIRRCEFANLARGMRIDKVKISQGHTVQALFAARALAVWGYDLDHYFFRFPLSVGNGVGEVFLLLRGRFLP